MIEVNSFAQLRTTVPAASGDIAMLKRYYDKDDTFQGGGRFVAFKGSNATPADDGGTVAVGSGFYWQRIIDSVEAINIYHFGGKRLLGDKTKDADNGSVNRDACLRMLTWAKGFSSPEMDLTKNPIHDVGIRFPVGKFMVNPIDLSGEKEMPFFNVYGDDCEYGVQPRTIIISDKSKAPVFKVNARRTAIRGLFWDGQATADVKAITGAIPADKISNNQVFFENTVVAGQYVNITACRVENNGGAAFKLVDTLDTRLDQIYSKNTYGRVFEVTWSNAPNGHWDHSTAIELSNSNFQLGYSDATLYMPRVTQGLMRNVWIEHTRFPGDLTNGQWIIDALSIESSDNPMVMSHARVMFRALSLQSGGRVDLSPTSAGWLSAYEDGWRRDENYGTVMTGSLRAGWYSGYRISNRTTEDKWFHVGKFHFRYANQHWHLEINGKSKTDVDTKPVDAPLLSNVCGKTYVNLYRSDNAVDGNIHFEGDSGVNDCFVLSANSGGTCEVWVKLKANCGDVILNLKNTGPTRFDEGQSSLFYPDFTENTPDLSNKSRLKLATKMTYHNGAAGYGFDNNIVTLATAAAEAPAASAAPAGYITVKINGVNRKLAYF